MTCDRCSATRREVCSTEAGESLCLNCYAAGPGGVRVSDEEFQGWERDRDRARRRPRRKPDDVDRVLGALRRVGRVEYAGAARVVALCPICGRGMGVEFGPRAIALSCSSGCDERVIADALEVR